MSREIGIGEGEKAEDFHIILLWIWFISNLSFNEKMPNNAYKKIKKKFLFT